MFPVNDFLEIFLKKLVRVSKRSCFYRVDSFVNSSAQNDFIWRDVEHQPVFHSLLHIHFNEYRASRPHAYPNCFVKQNKALCHYR